MTDDPRQPAPQRADPAPLTPEAAAQAAAAQVGLRLQPHHLPGVAENLARLTLQGELLLTFPLDESEEPAPVYRP